jgi:hypothetical protein
MKKTNLLMTLLLALVICGCGVTVKYQGVTDLTAAHPKGFEDSVNGSFHRDGGNESEAFMRELLRYTNQLEYELERR